MKFPHIQVITASAGSGKTFTLSERYINFLLSPEINAYPCNILAITFTKKAAGEMKDRIISHLKEIAMGDSELKQVAANKLDELLDKYSDIKIQTIDSFFTSISRASALELRLPPDFEIVLDPKPTFNFVLDELLSQVYPNSQGIRLNNIFLNLLSELITIKDELGWNIKSQILENIRNLIERESLTAQKVMKVSVASDIEKIHILLKDFIQDFLKREGDGLVFDKRFIMAVDKFMANKKYQPWESAYFLKDGMEELCNKGSIITPSHEDMWQRIRRGVTCLTEITAHCRYAPFIDIISLFDEGLASFKARAQMIFIADLNRQLKNFLSQEGIVPEVFFHLGERISHFLIDEFQDTNRLQWGNLFPLIEETLSKAGSFFYVGDKKQAIYGFRGGESALFDEIKESFDSVDAENIQEEFPKINYRSRENIIGFVNYIFSSENLTRWAENNSIIDLPAILKTYQHSEQEANLNNVESHGGFVRVEVISPNNPLKTEDMVIEVKKTLIGLIREQILPRFSPDNIAILVRTNNEAIQITNALTMANIPVASPVTLDIFSHNLIQEVVAFLSFLDSPIDNFSFACFICGEIFLEASGLSKETINTFLLEHRQSPKPLYTLFRDRFRDVWQGDLEEYFQAVGFLPPYDLVSRILKKYNVFQNFSDEEGVFYQLLELLKQGETEGRNSLKAFLTFWNSHEENPKSFQVVLPDYMDAVKVLTIHKAKGLGFPIVIIPFAYLKNEPIVEVYEENDGAFIPYRINEKMADASPKLKKLRQSKFTAGVTEELNIFYVALTRAINELYIFIPNYKKRTLPLPIFFKYPIKDSIFEIGSQLEGAEVFHKQIKKHIYPPLTNEWQDKLCRQKVTIDELIDPVRKKAIEKGIFIHKLLSRVERLSEQRWEEEIEDKLSLKIQEESISSLLRIFFRDERLRRWFTLPEDVSVFCEKELIDSDGKEYRVDRLLIFPDKVVVIDFKSGEPQDKEHKRQIMDYLRVVADIYPNKVVGWLVYIDEAIQEMVEWAG